MSSTNSSSSTLSKADLQVLVTSNNPLVSFAKPAGVRSQCWSNYTQVYHENIPLDFIVCLQCKTVLKWTSGNGTRVMNHHNCIKKKPLSETPNRQRTVSSYCQQSSSSTECPLIKKRITEACVEYCAVDGRSFESVTGAGFINLAKQLISAGATIDTSVSASALLPHPSTISRNVERMYLDLKKQLISLCESIKFFCITCDFWSEKTTGIHYGGLSLHYVDAKWQLRVFTLACQAYDYESQHAINLRAFVNEILEEFGLYLNDDIFIVSDNENKMKSAFKEDVQRVGCSAHYLNKILQHAFTKDDIKCDVAQVLFKTVRSIVTKIRQCHTQSLLSSYVQNYSDTRFNGVYIMFNSLLKVYYELPTVLTDEYKKHYLKIDRDTLELFCEKTPTLHLVIPYKQFLINLSSITDNDDQLIIPLKMIIVIIKL
ncbi:unnamed protein product [Didymodactylos carnosus]|uniref:Hermes trasposase DNA-binding domain-containing protein n=1 Tax=Didymodactylos carnosus TaxID=1234261 RepID=A0A815RP71_9BILA|nr:unnamed protein product [Didymodactylos carnosus]CAF4345034.1 unnamed protein product [Didymodactylos carnosus]